MGAEAAERARLVEEFKQRKREAAENRARGINDFKPPVCPKLNLIAFSFIVYLCSWVYLVYLTIVCWFIIFGICGLWCFSKEKVDPFSKPLWGFIWFANYLRHVFCQEFAHCRHMV